MERPQTAPEGQRGSSFQDWLQVDALVKDMMTSAASRATDFTRHNYFAYDSPEGSPSRISSTLESRLRRPHTACACPRAVGIVVLEGTEEDEPLEVQKSRPSDDDSEDSDGGDFDVEEGEASAVGVGHASRSTSLNAPARALPQQGSEVLRLDEGGEAQSGLDSIDEEDLRRRDDKIVGRDDRADDLSEMGRSSTPWTTRLSRDRALLLGGGLWRSRLPNKGFLKQKSKEVAASSPLLLSQEEKAKLQQEQKQKEMQQASSGSLASGQKQANPKLPLSAECQLPRQCLFLNGSSSSTTSTARPSSGLRAGYPAAAAAVTSPASTTTTAAAAAAAAPLAPSTTAPALVGSSVSKSTSSISRPGSAAGRPASSSGQARPMTGGGLAPSAAKMRSHCSWANYRPIRTPFHLLEEAASKRPTNLGTSASSASGSASASAAASASGSGNAAVVVNGHNNNSNTNNNNNNNSSNTTNATTSRADGDSRPEGASSDVAKGSTSNAASKSSSLLQQEQRKQDEKSRPTGDGTSKVEGSRAPDAALLDEGLHPATASRRPDPSSSPAAAPDAAPSSMKPHPPDTTAAASGRQHDSGGGESRRRGPKYQVAPGGTRPLSIPRKAPHDYVVLEFRTEPRVVPGARNLKEDRKRAFRSNAAPRFHPVARPGSSVTGAAAAAAGCAALEDQGLRR